jgi:hypothetical protein
MPPLSPGKIEPLPHVCWLDKRKHLPTVLDLDAAASADRRRIYEGQPWTVGGFREYLNAGAGLVALNHHKTVIGFAIYSRKEDRVLVSKLVAPSYPAENALLVALQQTMKNCGAQHLDLPLILEIP